MIATLVVAVQMALSKLSEDVTASVVRVHGKVDLKCEMATNRLIRNAKWAGLPLEHCYGFYGSAQHHWASLGDFIVDPTGAQMTWGRNGVVTPSMLQYDNYDRIPEEVLDSGYLRNCPSSQLYWRWLDMKDNIASGCGPLVLNASYVRELRTSVRGDQYAYIKYPTSWQPGETIPLVRSVTVFRTKNGHNLLVWWAARNQNGKVRTWNSRYIVKDDWCFKTVKGGKLMPTYDFVAHYVTDAEKLF